MLISFVLIYILYIYISFLSDEEIHLMQISDAKARPKLQNIRIKIKDKNLLNTCQKSPKNSTKTQSILTLQTISKEYC